MFAIPNLRLRLAAVVLVMASIFTGATALTAAPEAVASDSTCVHTDQMIWSQGGVRDYMYHGSAGWSHRNYYRHKFMGAWLHSYSVSCPYN